MPRGQLPSLAEVVGRADRSRSPRRERPPAPEPDWKRFKLGSSSMLRETKRERERVRDPEAEGQGLRTCAILSGVVRSST